MKAANDPVREAVDVYVDLPVNFRPPRREIGTFRNEAVDGLLTKIANKIHRRLEA